MQEKQENMILEHKPVRGYRSAFYIALAVGILYLVLVFGRALY